MAKKEFTVEWYFAQGANRPSDKFYIRYNPVTFIPELIKK